MKRRATAAIRCVLKHVDDDVVQHERGTWPGEQSVVTENSMVWFRSYLPKLAVAAKT